MEEILKAALKVADAADLFWVESRSTPVAFESNRLKHLQTKESRGVGLRIIKDVVASASPPPTAWRTSTA